MVRPRSCRHPRMAGGRVGGVRSLSPLTSATEAADSTPYRLTIADMVGQSVAVMPIRTVGPDVDGSDRVLTAPALAFVEDLTRRFRGRIDELLSRRRERQARLEGGAALDFLPETSTVRQGDWKVAPAPPTSRIGAWRSPVRSIAR